MPLPRAYVTTESFLRKKSDLADLIYRQIDKWPERSFNVSKTNITKMKAILLDPSCGFTKEIQPEMPTLQIDQAESPLSSLPSTPPNQSHRDESAMPSAHNVGKGKGIEDNERSLVAGGHSEEERDKRCYPVSKSVIQVTLEFFENEDGNLCVSTEEVVAALQNSLSAVTGNAKLSCPFPDDQTYKQYFAEVRNSIADCSKFQPGFLVVPNSLRLFIQINPIEQNSSTHSGINKNADTSSSPSGRKIQRQSGNETTISWLKNQAESKDDFLFFKQSKNRPLQNPEIVRVWKFVDNFYRNYYHAKGAGGFRVTQKDIHAALDVHETWLNECLAAARRVSLYGPDGIYRADEVVKELSITRKPPLGRNKLMEFLEKWEQSHPQSD
ncbi:hypothetical protein CVT26_012579 [Gymnopilus dilepis]|uniref:Uncharacterized protein n=1 Tax=Gymnopilus dilepis TaxID=231916 RepID=A0A409YPU0_9AGAR|nr:hypothetical protein CVT26_012579 [Gymnopilus dilepis]